MYVAVEKCWLGSRFAFGKRTLLPLGRCLQRLCKPAKGFYELGARFFRAVYLIREKGLPQMLLTPFQGRIGRRLRFHRTRRRFCSIT